MVDEHHLWTTKKDCVNEFEKLMKDKFPDEFHRGTYLHFLEGLQFAYNYSDYAGGYTVDRKSTTGGSSIFGILAANWAGILTLVVQNMVVCLVADGWLNPQPVREPHLQPSPTPTIFHTTEPESNTDLRPAPQPPTPLPSPTTSIPQPQPWGSHIIIAPGAEGSPAVGAGASAATWAVHSNTIGSGL
ncbi:hypothetical protein Tco_0681387 [Tanacetum coccineum]|uniref:Uncharacterized protein n=1 Tax=Tanacetum coccineum TaxID=301880 RepID=A0ABQ4XN64_9ASTR